MSICLLAIATHADNVSVSVLMLLLLLHKVEQTVI